MPEYLAPGVYVEETSFRSKSIEGVSTTTTGFVGPTRYGPHRMVPDVVTSLAEFERVYGDGEQLQFDDSGVAHNYTWHAVRAFFENGGRRLYVVRVVDASAATAAGPVVEVAAAAAFTGDGARTAFTTTAATTPILPGTVRIERDDPTNEVTGEDLGATVDGTTAIFNLALEHAPNGSPVTVRWTSANGAQSATITGTTASGAGNNAGTSLDRATGALTLDTTGEVPTAGAITVDYAWDDNRVFVDNGAGQLVGEAGATGVLGTVDYATGEVAATFATAPANGQVWTLAHDSAAATVSARFAGRAGNGTLLFIPRAGQHRPFTAGSLPPAAKDGSTVVVGDIVSVLHSSWRVPEWRKIAGTPGNYTLTSLRASDRTTNGSSDNTPLDASIIRLAKANGLTITWTLTGQTAPNGIWDGLEPTTAAVTEYFTEFPSSDERARTLPVIVSSIQTETLYGGTVTLVNGTDGDRPDDTLYEGAVDPATDEKTGLKALEDIEAISIVAAPGIGTFTSMSDAQNVALAVQAHVERMRYRVGVIDSLPNQSISEIRQFRALFDSKHMALYYPWVRVADPITRKEINLPPSGFVTGIYARNDINRAVYKAPANEVVSLALGFERTLNKAQQEVLNPEGINCLRFFEGRGMRVWGARTMSSDPEWKYINVRRYFAYLEHSIDRGTQWAVFEPNGSQLWGNVTRTIQDFLLNEFQSGALLGDKAEKAFFVRCDRSTMTQNDLDNGRLICLVGVAPLKPAEFVIFRIGQWTADAKN